MNKSVVACVKCRNEITTNNFKRHVECCNGLGTKIEKQIKLKEQKQKEKLCLICGTIFQSCYSLASHVRFCQRNFDVLGRNGKRKYLFKSTNYACSQCGFDKKRSDGGCILEIDHIDGDHTNNTKENLRVLCPNCHALTPNFRNWGRTSKYKTSKRLRRENKNFKSSAP